MLSCKMRLPFLTWFFTSAISVVVTITKGNSLCDKEGTRLPTKATLTCDGAMNVYVDGNKIKKKYGYSITAEYEIPVGSSVLALYCKPEKTVIAKILGMIGNTMLSGGKGWSCTNQYYPRWNTSDFVDSLWAPAVAHGRNLNLSIPHGRVVKISSEAEWIGTAGDSTRNNTLYCRVLLCPKKTCTYYSATRIDNHRLIDHTFSIFGAQNFVECAFKCSENIGRCFSFNYNATAQEASCELNNSTQILTSTSLVRAPGVVYYIFKTIYP